MPEAIWHECDLCSLNCMVPSCAEFFATQPCWLIVPPCIESWLSLFDKDCWTGNVDLVILIGILKTVP